MSFDFDKVIRGNDVVLNFPIKRWQVTTKPPFLARFTEKRDLYYPQLTIGETERILTKYLKQDMTPEVLKKFKKSEIVRDLFRIYRRNEENRFLKKRDLLTLEKEDLMILVMDTVQRFVKKKLRETEEGKPYRVLLYSDYAFSGARLPSAT